MMKSKISNQERAYLLGEIASYNAVLSTSGRPSKGFASHIRKIKTALRKNGIDFPLPASAPSIYHNNDSQETEAWSSDNLVARSKEIPAAFFNINNKWCALASFHEQWTHDRVNVLFSDYVFPRENQDDLRRIEKLSYHLLYDVQNEVVPTNKKVPLIAWMFSEVASPESPWFKEHLSAA